MSVSSAGAAALYLQQSVCRLPARDEYAEVEGSEADLQRFSTWPGKIADRDYFGTLDRS